MAQRVVIIGAGHMGTAIALGLRGTDRQVSVQVVEKNAERRRHLLARYGLASSAEATTVPGDVVVLAVPPQSFQAFAAGWQAEAHEDCLVVSVMAGIRIAAISEALGTDQVVRSIPNTPSEVSQGMTVMCAGDQVDAAGAALTQEILACLGKVLVVDEEPLIDDATALCGGGPAFVAYYAGAMQDFAVDCGFSQEGAKLMVAQILRGTADMLDLPEKSPSGICTEVMTPNGTTEQGIFFFREQGLQEVVAGALRRSATRSRELSGLQSGD